MRHPKFIERWRDFDNPPPIFRESRSLDPHTRKLERELYEARVQRWKADREPYWETYFWIVFYSIVVVGGLGLAFYKIAEWIMS